MELPGLGKNCNFSECNKLDFLPAECKYCSLIFCSIHLFPSNHKCDKVVETVAQPNSREQGGGLLECNWKGCSTRDPVEMLCVKCRTHFCLEHRYHTCFDQTPSQARREKQRAPIEQFKKAKQHTDKIVEEKLSKAKNRAMANKIKLMRVRGFAQGDASIPTAERLFLCVCPPLCGQQRVESRPLYVSRTWTLGRCVDSLAKRLKLNNRNGEVEADKLRLFSGGEGVLLGPGQDTPVVSYLDDGTLVDGDNVILEYVPQQLLDTGLTALPAFLTDKHKYIWTK